MRVSRLSLVLGATGWIVAALFAAMLLMNIPLQAQIGVGDTVRVNVLGTLPDMPIAGAFVVPASGMIDLGQPYGSAEVADLTVGDAQKAINNHLRQILTAPESSVMLVQSAAGVPLRHSLPRLGWIVVLALALLLAVTVVRSHTVPEPQRVGVQFGTGTLLCLVVIAALSVFAFMERRERLRIQQERPALGQRLD